MAYTHSSGLPANQTRAIASQVRDELDLIAADFASRPTAAALHSGANAAYADTGIANALVIAANSNVTAYADLQTYKVRIAATNTGASTVNVNALGLRPIVRVDGTALQANDMVSGQIVELAYDALNLRFQLISAASYASASPPSVGTNTPVIGAQLYLQANYGVL